MFTSVDHEKFKALRIAHLATRFEELVTDEANDELTPGQIFLTAVDDALAQRQAHRIEELIRAAKFPIRRPRSPRSTTRKDVGSPGADEALRRSPMAPGPHEPAGHLTDRWRKDLPGLRHRDRRLPERTHSVIHSDG